MGKVEEGKPPIMHAVRSAIINFLIVCVSLSVAVGLLELGLRVVHPLESRVHGAEINLPVHRQYRITNSTIPGLDENIVHTKNGLGFRGSDWPKVPENWTKWLFVGGSTTEGFYLSDGDTWPELAGALAAPTWPQLWVANAGLDGQTTFGHQYLLSRVIAPLKPQAVFFLIGINDVGYDAPKAFDDRLKEKTTVLRWVSSKTEIGSLVSTLWGAYRAKKMGLTHGHPDLTALGETAYPNDRELADELARHGERFLPAFGQRLQLLADTCLNAGIRPVFITQPALYGPVVDPTTGRDLGRLDVNGRSGAAQWRLLEAYNDVTRRIAAERGIGLIDLARQMPKDSALYYDFIHYNKAGHRRVAQIVADAIPSLGLAR